MAIGILPPPRSLRVGSVVELGKGEHTRLLVQETESRLTVVTSWEDGFALTNRLLGRLKKKLERMNTAMSASNQRLAKGLRQTSTKIAANQRRLDELIKDRT